MVNSHEPCDVDEYICIVKRDVLDDELDYFERPIAESVWECHNGRLIEYNERVINLDGKNVNKNLENLKLETTVFNYDEEDDWDNDEGDGDDWWNN